MLSQIQSRLANHRPVRNPYVAYKASVLIPLVERDQEIEVLLTRRSQNLRSFSGHVSFPGGKQDPEDASDYATALRESQEEIGLSEVEVRSFGVLEQILSPQGCLVTPFVGAIPAEFEPTINEAEIDSVFWAPLSFFMNDDNHTLRQVSNRRPYSYYTHHFFYGPYHIWGMTALLILRLLEVAFDFRPSYPLTHPQEPHWIQIAQNFKEAQESSVA
jgi:8-oxo-dGTP pyrophosphatase MutT (NUDIX family)